MKIEIDDTRVLAKFQRMANEAPRACEDIVSNLGAVALKEARNKVPVDTGALKGSLTLEVERNGNQSSAIIGSNLEYAPPVEYGTSYQSPQPYMRPAKKVAESKLKQITQEVFNELNNIKRKTSSGPICLLM